MLKNFRLQVIFRVLFLALSMALAVYLLFDTTYYISFVLLCIVIIFQVVQLIRYADQTNRKLSRFLNSIRYSDFSRSFTGKKLGRSFLHLDETFEDVIDEFKKQRIETQVHFRYLQTVVQHVGIGLISFNHEGDVELINTAAKRLFNIATLRSIDDLGNVSEPLLKAIKEIPGGSRAVTGVNINEKLMQLSMHATTFRMHSDMYKLVSFQNIHSELEDKEMEAWQNLTQVLAHEIMNSVTPIASLSDTVYMLLRTHIREQKDNYIIQKEAVQDVGDALNTIKTRSEGLVRFVNSYRDFTRIPDPEVSLFSVEKLLLRTCNLNKGEAQSHDITLKAEVEPKSLELMADPHLIEQVLINLIKNAFRALEHTDHGTVTLRGLIAENGNTAIQVHDNGPGIPPENLEKIFIPFYSTERPTVNGGSGIGLSLSRQIMRAHKGNLKVTSDAKKGTTFTLQF